MKTRFRHQHRVQGVKYASFIPKKDMDLFENEMRQINRNAMFTHENCEQASENFMLIIRQTISHHTKKKRSLQTQHKEKGTVV